MYNLVSLRLTFQKGRNYAVGKMKRRTEGQHSHEGSSRLVSGHPCWWLLVCFTQHYSNDLGFWYKMKLLSKQIEKRKG